VYPPSPIFWMASLTRMFFATSCSHYNFVGTKYNPWY
jgi:hypothetical protein